MISASSRKKLEFDFLINPRGGASSVQLSKNDCDGSTRRRISPDDSPGPLFLLSFFRPRRDDPDRHTVPAEILQERALA